MRPALARGVLALTAVTLTTLTTGCPRFHAGPLPGAPADATFVEVDGVHVRYREAGTGPAVVMLHGYGASSESWLPVIPSVARAHRVIAVDLKGFGWTSRPEGDYSPAAQAALVWRVLDKLGVGDVAIVGHSWGSSVALSMAVAQPARDPPRRALRRLRLRRAGAELLPLVREAGPRRGAVRAVLPRADRGSRAARVPRRALGHPGSRRPRRGRARAPRHGGRGARGRAQPPVRRPARAAAIVRPARAPAVGRERRGHAGAVRPSPRERARRRRAQGRIRAADTCRWSRRTGHRRATWLRSWPAIASRPRSPRPQRRPRPRPSPWTSPAAVVAVAVVAVAVAAAAVAAAAAAAAAVAIARPPRARPTWAPTRTSAGSGRARASSPSPSARTSPRSAPS